MRVASLLPSATEILLAITGPDAATPRGPVHLVGRSHECDFPKGLEHIPVLTAARTTFTTAAEVDRQVREQLSSGASLYTLDTALLESLQPDLIITQDLCEVCSIDLNTVRAVVARMARPPAIVSLNPQTFEGVFDDILTVGEAVGMPKAAVDAVVALRQRAYAAEEFVTPFTDRVNTTFMEWTDPIFIGGHWTPQLIERAGGVHPLNPSVPIEGAGAAEGPIGQTLRRAGKSVRVPSEILAATRPEALIICPCGLSLEQALTETRSLAAQPWWSTLPAVKRNKVAVIDGNHMFNRPGPRLVDALEFLVGYLNDRPELIPRDFPWAPWPKT